MKEGPSPVSNGPFFASLIVSPSTHVRILENRNHTGRCTEYKVDGNTYTQQDQYQAIKCSFVVSIPLNTTWAGAFRVYRPVQIDCRYRIVMWTNYTNEARYDPENSLRLKVAVPRQYNSRDWYLFSACLYVICPQSPDAYE